MDARELRFSLVEANSNIEDLTEALHAAHLQVKHSEQSLERERASQNEIIRDRDDLATLVIDLEDQLSELSRDHEALRRRLLLNDQQTSSSSSSSVALSKNRRVANNDADGSSSGSSSNRDNHVNRGEGKDAEHELQTEDDDYYASNNKDSTFDHQEYVERLTKEIEKLKKERNEMISENRKQYEQILEHEETVNALSSEIIELKQKIKDLEKDKESDRQKYEDLRKDERWKDFDLTDNNSKIKNQSKINQKYHLNNFRRTYLTHAYIGWKMATEAKVERSPLSEWRGGRSLTETKGIRDKASASPNELRTVSPLKAWKDDAPISFLSQMKEPEPDAMNKNNRHHLSFLSGGGNSNNSSNNTANCNNNVNRLPAGPPPFKTRNHSITSKSSQQSDYAYIQSEMDLIETKSESKSIFSVESDDTDTVNANHYNSPIRRISMVNGSDRLVKRLNSDEQEYKPKILGRPDSIGSSNNSGVSGIAQGYGSSIVSGIKARTKMWGGNSVASVIPAAYVSEDNNDDEFDIADLSD